MQVQLLDRPRSHYDTDRTAGKRVLRIGELFSGGGGSLSGMEEACDALGYAPDITAVNHNPDAVATLEANHPSVRVLRTDVDRLRYGELAPAGALDILWGSPSCSEHSYAKGGANVDDQERVSAWAIVREIERYHPSVVIVENVRNFVHWGPVAPTYNPDGTPRVNREGKPILRPIRARRGEIYRSWVNAICSYGYRRVGALLDAAGFGVPQNRLRSYTIFVVDGLDYVMPPATHGDPNSLGVKTGLLHPYVGCGSVLDLSLPAESVFLRSRALSDNTMRRVIDGILRFGFADEIDAYLTVMSRFEHFAHLAREARVRRPATARCGVGPFVFGNRMHNVPVDAATSPAPTLTTAHSGGVYLGQPVGFVLGQHGGGIARSLRAPFSTISTDGYVRLFRGAMEPVSGVYRGDVDPRQIVELHGVPIAIDLLCRPLDVRELAAVQDFRPDYVFAGNKGSQTAQIGNAVPRAVARALTRQAILAIERRGEVAA